MGVTWDDTAAERAERRRRRRWWLALAIGAGAVVLLRRPLRWLVVLAALGVAWLAFAPL